MLYMHLTAYPQVAGDTRATGPGHSGLAAGLQQPQGSRHSQINRGDGGGGGCGRTAPSGQ